MRSFRRAGENCLTIARKEARFFQTLSALLKRQYMYACAWGVRRLLASFPCFQDQDSLPRWEISLLAAGHPTLLKDAKYESLRCCALSRLSCTCAGHELQDRAGCNSPLPAPEGTGSWKVHWPLRKVKNLQIHALRSSSSCCFKDFSRLVTFGDSAQCS